VKKCDAVLRAAEVAGLDMDEDRARLGLSARTHEGVDGHVTISRYIDLWERVMRRLHDPSFPLAVARAPVEDLGLVGFLVMTSQTVSEALDRGIRYQRIWASRGQWELPRAEPRKVSILWTPFGSDARLGVRASTEFAMASMVSGVRALSRTELVPKRVLFTHPCPTDIAAHRALFGTAPRFGAPRTLLEFDASDLALPIATANLPLSAYLEAQCRAVLAEGPADEPTVARVRALIIAAMRSGTTTPSGTSAARQLGLSHRTLLRRLAEAGHSYQGILDRIRRDATASHLHEGRLTISEIAYLVGFSSLSAFHRARRRWQLEPMPPRQKRGVALASK
jgi:AraC-like DNA-binding protein